MDFGTAGPAAYTARLESASVLEGNDSPSEGREAMIHLRWAKAKDGWLPLALPWPSVVDTIGVYIIWHEGNPSRVVRIGHGRISECLPLSPGRSRGAGL